MCETDCLWDVTAQIMLGVRFLFFWFVFMYVGGEMGADAYMYIYALCWSVNDIRVSIYVYIYVYIYM